MPFILEEEGYETFQIGETQVVVDVLEVQDQMFKIFELNKDDPLKQLDAQKEYLVGIGFPPNISFNTCEKVFRRVIEVVDVLRKKFPIPSSESPS